MHYLPVADPGFPIGGGAELLVGCQPPTLALLAKTFVKMKELDPIGGGGRRAGSALDPPMFAEVLLKRLPL